MAYPYPERYEDEIMLLVALSDLLEFLDLPAWGFLPRYT